MANTWSYESIDAGILEMRSLADFEVVTNQVLRLVAKDTFLKSDQPLDEILSAHPRLLVVFNHASPLSWIPAPCLLSAHLCARGGGYRRPIAIMDRFFYSVPLLKDVARYITQSEKPLKFEEAVEHFEKLETADLVVFPEGSNCFFGSPMEIQPFRSHRFVEIALRTNTPLLVCVHRGSEHWGFTAGKLTLPRIPTPMEKFSMLVRLHHLTPGASADRETVLREAERVHELMREMLQELDSLID